MKKLRIAVSVLILGLPLKLAAGEIKGVVKDKDSKGPVAGAMVIVSPGDKDPVMTDENGAYVIKGLKAGTYKVTANYSGATAEESVLVADEGTVTASLVVSMSQAKATTYEVTASRIPRPNIDASVPVTTLTAAELTQTGDVSLGDAISRLPSFTPGFSSQNSGRFIGTAGLSVLDLRGQGTERTLVLQNGRRHVTSSPGTSAVDVNTIPNDLLERVDVVTGGNSAIYGSDAVAGVVNFITKRDYEGVGLRAQSGFSSRLDRPTLKVSLTAGKNFDNGRGNIAGNAELTLSNPIYYSDREWAGAFGRSQFQLTENTAFPTPEPPEGRGEFDTTFLTGIRNNNVSTGGLYSSSCPAASVPPNPANTARRALNCSGVFNSAGTAQFGNTFVFRPDGTLVQNVLERDFRPFGSSNSQGGEGSTLREVGLLQTGTNSYGLNLLGSYKVIDAFRPFLEAKLVRTESIQEGQPTFFNNTFRLDNPFLSDQARTQLATSLAPGATTFRAFRFNTDFAGRGENHIRTLYRVVAGADGKFFDTWRYEAAFNYGRVNTFYRTRGNLDLNKYDNAIAAVRNPGGQIVCAINNDLDPDNDDPSCVPLNLFGLGAPSQAALDYIRYDSTRDEFSDQLNAVAYFSGDLGKLFTMPGGEPVAFSLGGEWRQESSFSAFDAFTREGNTFLNAIDDFAPPTLNIYEGFGELRIPLLTNLPFAKELTLEGAGRVSHYTQGGTGTVWTGNVGAIYSPIEDIRIRGSYALAVRAPTQSDLFSSPSQTFLNGLVDPCGQQNITANPNRIANCAAAGVPLTQTFNNTTEPFTNRPASGISGLQGGNPDLTAEKSNSYTIGGIFQPSFVRGLVLSIDYYNIDLSNAINTIGAQTIINQCYDSPDGIDNQFCRAITRNPNGTFAGQTSVLHGGDTVTFDETGSSFLEGPFNYARQNTSGIDTDISYTGNFGPDWRFQGRAIIAYLLNRDYFTSTTEPDRLTQGKYNLGNPAWNGQLRLKLGFREFDLGWNLRYVGEMTVAAFSAQNSEQGRPPTNLDAFPIVWYPVVTYSDVRANVKIEALKANFFLGVDNLFDQIPPLGLLGTGGGDAIYTNTGRYFYFGADFGF